MDPFESMIRFAIGSFAAAIGVALAFVLVVAGCGTKDALMACAVACVAVYKLVRRAAR